MEAGEDLLLADIQVEYDHPVLFLMALSST